MLWPMVIYISASKKAAERIRRRFSFGVSVSFRASSCAASFALAPERSACCASLGRAPYPASVTALMISAADAVPSTPMELVRRLTVQADTPGTLLTAFSTRAWQAAQLIPVTIY